VSGIDHQEREPISRADAVSSPGAGRRRLAGIAAILAAATLWGSTGTVAHFAPAGASPAAVGAGRIVLGGAILVLIALISKDPHRVLAGGQQGGSGRGAEFRGMLRSSWPQRVTLGIGAIGVAGYQLCFFSGVKLTGVAIGTMVAIGSAPVFTGLISKLTGTARLNGRWFIATAAAIAGCAVLLLGGRSAGVNLAGASLALLAGLCYGGYAVSAARLIKAGATERPVMAIMFGAGAVLLLPVFAVTSASWLLTWRGVLVIVELGALATAAAYLFYGYGLRSVQVPTAVTLGLAEPVVAAVLALGVLGERLTGAAVAGLLLVGAALALLARSGRPSRSGRSASRVRRGPKLIWAKMTKRAG
jgi:DME family drug/metabolite transporter